MDGWMDGWIDVIKVGLLESTLCSAIRHLLFYPDFMKKSYSDPFY